MTQTHLYTQSPHNAYSGSINDLGDDDTVVKLALLDSSHTTSTTGHTHFSDVSDDEIDEGGGYDAGGQEVTTKVLDHTDGTTEFSCDDVLWSNSTITASYAVLYEETSGVLLSLVDFEGEEDSQDDDFLIEWSDGYVFRVEA